MSLMITDKGTGTVMVFKKTAADTGGAYLEVETSLPPRAKGPPPHVHFLQDEEVEVLQGRMGLRVGRRARTAEAGEQVFLPRAVAHTFWNAGDRELRLRGLVRPAGSFEPYIRAMYAATHTPTGRRSLFDVAYLFDKYRAEFAPTALPPPVGRVLFASVVRLGHLLGRYDALRLARLEPLPAPASPGPGPSVQKEET